MSLLRAFIFEWACFAALALVLALVMYIAPAHAAVPDCAIRTAIGVVGIVVGAMVAGCTIGVLVVAILGGERS